MEVKLNPFCALLCLPTEAQNFSPQGEESLSLWVNKTEMSFPKSHKVPIPNNDAKALDSDFPIDTMNFTCMFSLPLPETNMGATCKSETLEAKWAYNYFLEDLHRVEKFTL